MRQVTVVPCHSGFLEEVDAAIPVFEGRDYEQRLGLLAERIRGKGLDFAVIYADREHFANMDYFIGFEPRFEEALLIVDRNGACTLVTGNECLPYSWVSPVALTRVLYQNFSLQGQPRGESARLEDIFRQAGITAGSVVGLAGYKYFLPETIFGDPRYTFDVPAFILDSLRAVAGRDNIVNFTGELTGMPSGIRMEIRTAKEVAWAEYAAGKTTNVVLRMLKALKPGVSEMELSLAAMADFSPISVFPMINFGEVHGKTGIRSPGGARLAAGDPCGMCYAIRGALTSRVGVAAADEASFTLAYGDTMDRFYKPFWQAIAAWYETVGMNVPGGKVYDAVMGIIGGPEFGVVLNPGHYIGGDEWVNSPFAKGSDTRIERPAHLQCDIIASQANPFCTAICEDGVIVADESLRQAVALEYPDVWARIANRQQLMRQELGIDLPDDVLPLSNLNGVFFPYLLDLGMVFSFR